MLNLLKRMVFLTRQWWHRQTAPSKIQTYIQTHQVRKLQIGTGPVLIKGWLNTTLQPLKNEVVHLNAIKPYPMPDASFDYILSEHMIEHVNFQEGQAMLRECYRVLKSGGKIRLATPDLARILAIYHKETLNPEEEAYLHWTVDNFLKDTDGYNPSFLINKMFHGWGHVFVYDFETLKYALEKVGFVDVRRYQPSESEDPNLQNIEQHGKVIKNEAMNQFESLVVEAKKP